MTALFPNYDTVSQGWRRLSDFLWLAGDETAQSLHVLLGDILMKQVTKAMTRLIGSGSSMMMLECCPPRVIVDEGPRYEYKASGPPRRAPAHGYRAGLNINIFIIQHLTSILMLGDVSIFAIEATSGRYLCRFRQRFVLR